MKNSLIKIGIVFSMVASIANASISENRIKKTELNFDDQKILLHFALEKKMESLNFVQNCVTKVDSKEGIANCVILSKRHDAANMNEMKALYNQRLGIKTKKFFNKNSTENTINAQVNSLKKELGTINKQIKKTEQELISVTKDTDGLKKEISILNKNKDLVIGTLNVLSDKSLKPEEKTKIIHSPESLNSFLKENR